MFEILPHTADVRVRLVSVDERSLFVDGVAALLSVTKPQLDPREEETITLTVDAHDLTSLVVDFLNEVVWLLETRRLAPGSVTVVALEPTRLVASLAMNRAIGWERDVKAVTYHDAEVRFTDGAWTTTLVLDI